MAGEIQVNSVTALTELSGVITLNNVDSATNRSALGLNKTFLQIATAAETARFTNPSSGGDWDFGTSSTRSDDTAAAIIDNLNVSITTKNANSAFLYFLNLQAISTDAPVSGYPFVVNVYSSIDSYATPVLRGDQYGSSRNRVTAVIYPRSSASNYTSTSLGLSLLLTSSVAASTSVTFKVAVASSNAQTVFINYMHDPTTDAANFGDCASTAILAEISQ
jgi:hypothetical protein